MNIIQHARQMVDSGLYRETQGQNRGPKIDALNTEFGIPLGSSWCSTFYSKAGKLSFIDNGKKGIHLLYTASSQALLRWFKENGWTSNDPEDLLKWKGALIIRTDPDGVHGHVAGVEGRLTNGEGKLVALRTLEGNTDKNGGSNGDGAYERKRIIPLKPYKWTYCNTSHITGGVWWTN